MYKIFWGFLIGIAITMPLHAQLNYEGADNANQDIQEYFQSAYPQYDKPIIYIFFNNNQCYGCPQTIAMIENVYNQYYKDKYNLFIINYQNDQEYNFIDTYDLDQPLEVVLVQVNDGQAGAYKKVQDIIGLEEETSDPVSFSKDLRYQIDSFLPAE